MTKPDLNPDSKRYREIFQPYGNAIGELVLAWNSLHLELSKLFELTIKSPSRKMGMAIWYSTDNDYTQRNLLRAAAGKASHFTERQRDDVFWVLNKIDESLRHNRNDALHSPLMFVHNTPNPFEDVVVIPDITSYSPRAKSLLQNTGFGKKFKDYLSEQAEFAFALDSFVSAMHQAILDPVGHSWPEKPALPHAHRKKSHKA